MIRRLFTAVVALSLIASPAQAQFGTSSSDNIDNVVLRSLRGNLKSRMDRAFEEELEQLERVTGRLADPQRSRLRLAGMADQERVFAQVLAFRSRLSEDPQTIGLINNWSPELQELHRQAAQVFKGDSVLHKSLPSVLTAEQLTRVEAATEKLRNDLYEYAVRRTMMNARPSTVFPPEFQKAMSEAILAETNPPRNPDDSLKYQQQITCYKLAQIPEEKLRPLCDGQQWESIQQMRASGVQYAEMLRDADVFGDDE